MNTIAPSIWAMIYRCSALIGILSFFFSTILLGQKPPKIEWDRTLGGDNWEELNTIVPVEDGIVFGGTAQSPDWVYPTNGSAYPDFTLFKLDFDGNLLWKQAYGGTEEERVWALARTNDGGFLIGGLTRSIPSGNKTDTLRGDSDFWVVRTDSEGNKLWDKAYGGTGTDVLFSITAYPNGDFVLVGNSSSPISGEKTQTKRGSNDIWALRIDSIGTVLWDKTYGGNDNDIVASNRAVEQTPDGKLVVAGGTGSIKNTGELSSDNGLGSTDFWVLKIDPNDGALLWNHRYGGMLRDLAYGIRLSRDKSSYFVFGESNSLPFPQLPYGKTSDYKGGLFDFWIIKIDLNGQKMDFDLTFGGVGEDGLYDINENLFGDIILCGYSDSPKSNGLGDYDFKIICIDKFGSTKWDWNIGGAERDACTNMKRLPDGSMVFIGHSTSSKSAYKTEDNLGKNDFWIVKTGCHVDGLLRGYPQSDPCAGEPLTVEIVSSKCDSCLFYWEDFGHIGTTYELPLGFADSISVFVADENACIAYDTGYFEVFDPLDFAFEPKDTFFYLQQSVTIGGTNPDLQYIWNTGDTTASLVVAHAGVYALTVSDANGCTTADWIRVRELRKDGVYIPNVFTPDFDGADDYFNVYADYSVKRIITLQVYDRWGGLLYKKDNYQPNYETDGWDGTFKGKRMLPGGYKYGVIVEYINGDKEVFDGIITITR